MILDPVMRHERIFGARAQRAGFSLVELLVVLMILGLMAGVMVIGASAMLPGSYLSQTVHTLAAEVYGARSAAISQNHTYHIEYDIDANRYHLVTPFRKEAREAGELARTEEERLVTNLQEIPRGIEISRITIDGEDYEDGKVRVRFAPNGTVSSHSVLLTQGEYENQFTLEVLPLTGLIRFHDGDFVRELPEEGDFE